MRFLTIIVAGALVAACAQGVTRETDNDDDDVGVGGSGNTGGGIGPATCGNGRLDTGEQCDGDDVGSSSCQSLGFMMGTLACDPNCVLDATGCSNGVCGDGMVDGTEECDGSDLDGQTCASLGFTGGTLSCDSECMFTGCSNPFTDDFETGSFGTNWSTSGVGMWAPSTTTPHAGSYCAKSGFISDSQTSSLSTTLTFSAPGTITFWHRESSESSYDYLEFYVDSLMQSSWSGNNPWAMATFNVAQGTHVLEWRYSKDGSISDYEDSVYIDDIVATNGSAL